MSHVIIGTAGHVDHGKTALIKALTGEDTDRLREEKERGISIELGFAPFRLPGGRLAGVVDVPGHERFIHNMLAGIGGIDLVLLVVDVTEGVMPQTREHVEIMDLLKIPRGIVVLNKIDLAEDSQWLDLVEEDVREALSSTFLADAPYFRVSAHTGEGIEALKNAIDEMTRRLPPRDSGAPLRLPVDRVFTKAGFGTVVTGTLVAGKISVGENVEILPLGKKARVRQLQVHGAMVNEAFAGQRVAVNLAGVEKDVLERGSVLAMPGSLSSTLLLDARLTLLPGARAVKNLARVHVFLGTGRSVGRIVLLEKDMLEPGQNTLVQLRLEKELVAQRGDRFIVRSFSPMTTIGGGVILDASPPRHRRKRKEVIERLLELEKGDPAEPVLQRIRKEAVVGYSVLEKQAALSPEALREALARLREAKKVVQIGDLLVDAAAYTAWCNQILEELRKYHEANPLAPGMSKAELKSIVQKGLAQKVYDDIISHLAGEEKISVSSDTVSLFGYRPQPSAKDRELLGKIERLYLEGGMTPPTLKEICEMLKLQADRAEAYLNYLAMQETLVRLDDQVAFHKIHFDHAKKMLCRHFRENKTLTAAEFRDKLKTTRKFVLPLLETFDRLKWTRRQGDERILWRLDLSECEEGDGNG